MSEIVMKPVESSQIRAVGYLESECVLAVSFHPQKGAAATVYRYFGVSREQYDNMLRADSIGKYFHQVIRDKFDYQKVDSTPVAEPEGVELVHCALINFDNVVGMNPELADHPMFSMARTQLVEGLAKLGRAV